MKQRHFNYLMFFLTGMITMFIMHTINRHTVATKYMNAATYHSNKFRSAKTGILREYHFEHEGISIDCANAVMETW